MCSVEKFSTDLKRKRTTKSIKGMLDQANWLSYYDGTSQVFTDHGYRVFKGYLPTDLVDYDRLSADEFKLAIEHSLSNTIVCLNKERDRKCEASLPKAYQTYKATIGKAFDMASRDHGKTKQAIKLVDQAIQSLKGTPLELKYDSYAECANDYDNFIELMNNNLLLRPNDAYHKLNHK